MKRKERRVHERKVKKAIKRHMQKYGSCSRIETLVVDLDDPNHAEIITEFKRSVKGTQLPSLSVRNNKYTFK